MTAPPVLCDHAPVHAPRRYRCRFNAVCYVEDLFMGELHPRCQLHSRNARRVLSLKDGLVMEIMGS